MKKQLSLLALFSFLSVIGLQSANAFDWSNLNPAYWGHCPKCQKVKRECGCKKKRNCNPCNTTTGAAAPCDPCNKPMHKPCEPCDRLQEMNK